MLAAELAKKRTWGGSFAAIGLDTKSKALHAIPFVRSGLRGRVSLRGEQKVQIFLLPRS